MNNRPTRRSYNGERSHAARHQDASRNNGRMFFVLLAILIVLAVAVACVFAFKVMGVGNQVAPKAEEAASTTAFEGELPADAVATADDVVMTIAGSKDTYVLVGEDYIEAGCHAVDPDAGDITNTIVVTGEVDAATPGDYAITYTATTEDGAHAEAVRNVHVVDGFDQTATSIPVMMYHYVYTADNPPSDLDGNYILDTDLAEQCAYLQESGYYYPSYQELRAWIDGEHTLPAESVVLTFDDGEEGFIEHGIPVLEQYQVPATSFAIVKEAGAIAVERPSEYIQYQSHSYNMHRAGGGAGQGGIIHAMSQQEIYDDAMSANEWLGKCVAMAYPFGDNNEAAWKALDDAGILCAFTVKNARIHPGDNPMALNRVRIQGGNSLDGFKSLVRSNA